MAISNIDPNETLRLINASLARGDEIDIWCEALYEWLAQEALAEKMGIKRTCKYKAIREYLKDESLS